MANLRVVPYEPAHYEALAVSMPWLEARRAEELGRAPSVAFSGLVDGRLMACAGIAFQWAGLGSAWVAMLPEMRQYPVTLTRRVVRYLAHAVRALDLHRVEADVLADNEADRRWVTWMGFQEEGRMSRRGPHQETMLRYVLFPKGGAP